MSPWLKRDLSCVETHLSHLTVLGWPRAHCDDAVGKGDDPLVVCCHHHGPSFVRNAAQPPENGCGLLDGALARLAQHDEHRTCHRERREQSGDHPDVGFRVGLRRGSWWCLSHFMNRRDTRTSFRRHSDRVKMWWGAQPTTGFGVPPGRSSLWR